MRVLILGATGMLGHVAYAKLSRAFEVVGTIREPAEQWRNEYAFAAGKLVGEIDALAFDSVNRLLVDFRPNVVLNGIGITKQSPEAAVPTRAIQINALFPHQLATACATYGCRLIHISTDCVFSGRRGPYSETDIPDPVDLYGRSKLLGEVDYGAVLTLRTSMIGHELNNHRGLLEWFLSNKGGSVRGFAHALFSGLTTSALADMLVSIIRRHANLTGIWHLTGEAIDKYSLLTLINDVYRLGIEVLRDEDFVCDRRLQGAALQARTGLSVPSWPEMITAMSEEHSLAEKMRLKELL